MALFSETNPNIISISEGERKRTKIKFYGEKRAGTPIRLISGGCEAKGMLYANY